MNKIVYVVIAAVLLLIPLSAHAEIEQLEGWPVEFNQGRVSPPTVADIDNDGKYEVVINAGHRKQLYVLEDDGTVKEGWPRQFSEYLAHRAPNVADLDSDGFLDIIVTVSEYIYAIDRNGNNLPGWPLYLSDQSGYYTPAIGDIDGDGDYELVFNGGSGYGGVYAYHHDGTVVSGWPQLKGSSSMYITLADIDKDGKKEIIAGCYNYWDRAGYQFYRAI